MWRAGGSGERAGFEIDHSGEARVAIAGGFEARRRPQHQRRYKHPAQQPRNTKRAAARQGRRAFTLTIRTRHGRGRAFSAVAGPRPPATWTALRARPLRRLCRRRRKGQDEAALTVDRLILADAGPRGPRRGGLSRVGTTTRTPGRRPARRASLGRDVAGELGVDGPRSVARVGRDAHAGARHGQVEVGVQDAARLVAQLLLLVISSDYRRRWNRRAARRRRRWVRTPGFRAG